MNIDKLIPLVAFAAAGVIACGGDEAQTVDCGEGTEFDEGTSQCVLSTPECDDGETYVEEFDECARIDEDYCGEGTEFDEDEQVCLADQQEVLDCGADAADDDGECIPAIEVSCGQGTVSHDQTCVPASDVCAGVTTDTDSGEDRVTCRPGEAVCGEGTEYDVSMRVCVPQSELECGPGTIEAATDAETTCVPTRAFYEALAEEPDLDLEDVEGTADIDLETEQRVVFVGNIDEPDTEDGEHIQDRDQLTFDAEQGQWLEVGVYSLGLPEPGYELRELDDTPNYTPFGWLSDVGAGLEMSRQFIVPSEATLELSIGNMPQMLGYAEPAGGDDWNYVGYVETFEPPEGRLVDHDEPVFEGDVRDLADNLYRFEEADGVDNIQFAFEELPVDTDATLNVLDSEHQIVDTTDLGPPALSVDTPGDDFFILFDYDHATGFSTRYAATGRPGESLDEGETTDRQIELVGGQFVRVSQYNTADAPLAGRLINGDGETVAETEQLAALGQSGQNYLHAYTDVDDTLTFELENTTDGTVQSLVTEMDVEYSQPVINVTGQPQTAKFDGDLRRGQRHYFELDVNFDERLLVAVEDAEAPVELGLIAEPGDRVATAGGELFFDAQPRRYALYVEATESMDDGFELSMQQTDKFRVDETSEPGAEIPVDEEDLTDTIEVTHCPVMTDLEVAVEITHQYRGDLVIDIHSPTGGVATIHNQSGGSRNNVIGTYPYPSDDHLEDGEQLLDFVDQSGEGDWEIVIADTWQGAFQSQGDLVSWGVHLVCEEEDDSDD